jgi:hypothetical protein
MQLGLRFAAAKLPGLRTGRAIGSLVEPRVGLGAQERIGDSEVFYRHLQSVVQ